MRQGPQLKLTLWPPESAVFDFDIGPTKSIRCFYLFRVGRYPRNTLRTYTECFRVPFVSRLHTGCRRTEPSESHRLNSCSTILRYSFRPQFVYVWIKYEQGFSSGHWKHDFVRVVYGTPGERGISIILQTIVVNNVFVRFNTKTRYTFTRFCFFQTKYNSVLNSKRFQLLAFHYKMICTLKASTIFRNDLRPVRYIESSCLSS